MKQILPQWTERKVGFKCIFYFQLQNKIWNVTCLSYDFSDITAPHVEIDYGVKRITEK